MKQKKEQASTFAFIDGQNLNLGVRSQGWKLDWRKFTCSNKTLFQFTAQI